MGSFWGTTFCHWAERQSYRDVFIPVWGPPFSFWISCFLFFSFPTEYGSLSIENYIYCKDATINTKGFCPPCLLKRVLGNSLAVQWLELSAFTAEGPDWISGCRTKIPQAVRCGQKLEWNRVLTFDILITV